MHIGILRIPFQAVLQLRTDRMPNTAVIGKISIVARARYIYHNMQISIPPRIVTPVFNECKGCTCENHRKSDLLARGGSRVGLRVFAVYIKPWSLHERVFSWLCVRPFDLTPLTE